MSATTLHAGQSYDYIICGGGTAGCVVAGRLAEDPDAKILVLEAGPHSENLIGVHMPGGSAQNAGDETDWSIVSEKGAGINGRQVELTRGKFLGGSSGTNGTLCIRASKKDYDDWNLPGWSGEEFHRYMSKAESFKSKPWFQAEEAAHGYTGHLSTEPHDLAPISKLIGESMESKGLPLDHDMFTHGRTAHGHGHATRSVSQGTRSTAADFLLKKNKKENTDIVTNVRVDKVIISPDDEGSLRAVGVRAILADGSAIEVKAQREVIISGGAYCSPNILNRSGIGAKDDLEKHGIETLVELPGVGKNLMDHPIVFLFYETEKPGLTNDHLIYPGAALDKTLQLWMEERKGFLASFPFGIFAFARLDERLADSSLWTTAHCKQGRDPMGLTRDQPNAVLFNFECYSGPQQFNQPPKEGQHAFSVLAELFGAKSRGTVALRSKDPMDGPEVDCGYLEDPLDAEVLGEACRFANEIIMEGAGTKGIVKGSWPPHLTHHTYSTREQWVAFARENATTCYHPSGTCAMGKVSDEKAVVDENLRVKGVKALRVVDVSIMPTLTGGHTQMAAYGIGEKAADLIKASWATSGR